MLHATKYSLKKTLSKWLLVSAIVASFFSGYAGNFSSESRHKTQTEWVASGRNFIARTFSIKFNNKFVWERSEISFLLFQNRLTQIAFITNLNKLKSFSYLRLFVQAKQPQVTEEEPISS